MAIGEIRFLHTGDWRFDRPFAGLVDIPPAMLDPLLEAPYRACERAFDVAVDERVDFVVVSGGALRVAHAGKRATSFIKKQFQRLHSCGIEAYWLLAEEDGATQWPRSEAIPENVRLLGRSHPPQHFQPMRGRGHVRLMALPSNARRAFRGGDLAIPPMGRGEPDDVAATIVLGFAPMLDAGSLETGAVDYWALSGQMCSKTLFARDGHAAHYAGSPQGRDLREPGEYGATLVDLNPGREVTLATIPCEALRAHDELVEITGTPRREQLVALLSKRLETLRRDSPEADWLVTLRLCGDANLADDALLRHVAESLREEFGRRSPFLWIVKVEYEAPEPGDSNRSGATAGDSRLATAFVRATREWLGRAGEGVDADDTRLDRSLRNELAPWLDLREPGARARLAAKARSLGLALLREEEETRK